MATIERERISGGWRGKVVGRGGAGTVHGHGRDREGVLTPILVVVVVGRDHDGNVLVGDVA